MQGTIIANRYLLAEEIGTGGMGNVYRATDLRTGGSVAVKIPHTFLARNPEYVERLRREAQIAASLASARVVRVMDLHEHEGVPFLVMEYVPGETLAETLRSKTRFTLLETFQVGMEIARALDAAHTRGIVHRDLKPQNIKLVDGEVKVLDFGIAKAEGFSGITSTNMFFGTPEYCAPERGEGSGDIRSDIYALGIIMFEMREGYLPFSGPTPLATLRKHERDPVPTFSGAVSAFTNSVLRRCLAKSPEDRYQTPRALIGDLSRAISDLVRADTAMWESDAAPAPAVKVAPVAPSPSVSIPLMATPYAPISAPPVSAPNSGARTVSTSRPAPPTAPETQRVQTLVAAAGEPASTPAPAHRGRGWLIALAGVAAVALGVAGVAWAARGGSEAGSGGGDVASAGADAATPTPIAGSTSSAAAPLSISDLKAYRDGNAFLASQPASELAVGEPVTACFSSKDVRSTTLLTVALVGPAPKTDVAASSQPFAPSASKLAECTDIPRSESLEPGVYVLVVRERDQERSRTPLTLTPKPTPAATPEPTPEPTPAPTPEPTPVSVVPPVVPPTQPPATTRPVVAPPQPPAATQRPTTAPPVVPPQPTAAPPVTAPPATAPPTAPPPTPRPAPRGTLVPGG